VTGVLPAPPTTTLPTTSTGTLAVVAHLAARGWRPLVVSRGYGRRPAPGTAPQATFEVRPDSLAAQVGDEPLLIRQRSGVPVWIGADRMQAARDGLAVHPECNLVVCDDGLQHAPLQPDGALIVFDDRRVGNGWLLPAGPLREPWPGRWARRDMPPAPHMWAIDTTPDAATALALPPGLSAVAAPRQVSRTARNGHGQQQPLAHWHGQSVHAWAGIARPQVFFDALRAQGLALSSTKALPDHYDFDSYFGSNSVPKPLFCTEKDAVKIWRHDPDVWAVPLSVQPDPVWWPQLEAALHQVAHTLATRHISAS
jgi:tetraacyldisaccharide 4'-kinase